MLRLVLISDTHNLLDEDTYMPDGDVLIHAGDLTNFGTIEELNRQAKIISEYNFDHKILVPGNHDKLFESDFNLAKQIFDYYGITVLCDSEITIDGKIFYGSPWQPEFLNWAFNLERDSDELKEKWSRIPDDVNVLITHGPPYKILDLNYNRQNVGDKLLLDRVLELKNLKLHVFGHVHPSKGVCGRNGITFCNAAVAQQFNISEPLSFNFI